MNRDAFYIVTLTAFAIAWAVLGRFDISSTFAVGSFVIAALRGQK